MRQLRVITIGSTLCLLIASCGPKNYDGPPDPGTPEPPPHKGSFICEYGEMTFIGDGKTVYIDFSSEYLEILDNPPNDVMYEYTFTWYSFGSCRYDVATEFKIYNEANDIDLSFSLYLEGKGTTEELIAFSYPIPKKDSVVFKKK